jgi:hypothetical protein
MKIVVIGVTSFHAIQMKDLCEISIMFRLGICFYECCLFERFGKQDIALCISEINEDLCAQRLDIHLCLHLAVV